ncbi:MAG: hypothetical protein ACJA0X_000142 [Cyclobacteriaceae bacterium]|jgi:hypothetical protein
MLKSLLRLIIKFWISLTAVLLIIIAVTSLIPLPELPEIPGNDKTLHLLAYIALSGPSGIAKPKSWWIILPLFFILFSGAIELIQPFVNRYGEWLDLLANASGVLMGTLMGLLTRRWLT